MAHHKIAFLADTHGLLREEVVQKIKDCEVIFHVGDFGGPEIVERLQQIAPVYMARGNNDKEWAKDMPYFVREQIGNRTFYMCHKKQDLPDELGEVDFVICGHSHKYELKQEGSICYINPGSCGPRRFHQPITFAILYFEDEAADYRIEKIDLSPALTKENAKKLSLSEKDLDRLIDRIIKEFSVGKSIEQIAKKNRVEKELVEAVCRMYATHPGITTAGIMEKLELRKLYVN